MRAGDSSLHERWLEGARDFHLVVQYYGATKGKYAGTADDLLYDPRPDRRNMSAMHRLLDENPHYLAEFDTFFLVDDDVETDAATISALFAVHNEFGLGLSQPALTHDSYFSHSITLAHPGLALRQVDFIEAMCPMFSKAALLACLPTFPQSISSWGLDWSWQTLLPATGERSAIIDCLPVKHTRPVGGGDNYLDLSSSPFEDGRKVCSSYGVHLAQHMRVQRAWDSDFEPVPSRRLPQMLLSRMARPTKQNILPGDGYAEGLRRAVRRQRLAAWSAGPEQVDAHRRSTVLSAIGSPPAAAVAPSGWSADELEMTRAHHAADAAAGGWHQDRSVGNDPGEAVDPHLGRLIGSRLRKACEAGDTVTVAYAADDPDLRRDLRHARTTTGIRIVICVDVGEDSAPVVGEIADELAAQGIGLDEVDVEVREQSPDPAQEMGVHLSRRRSEAPWKPGHPLPIHPLELEDLVLILRRSERR